MKMLVTVKQIVIQDVQFIANVPDNAIDPVEAAKHPFETSNFAAFEGVTTELYDSSDERIVETIVLSVREATEEESK